MEHLFHGSLFVAVVLYCNFQQIFAQQMPPIPIDKNVRIEELDNGLTYYIHKNSLSANRADLYVAQKMGSIQEEENQHGLAHSLEHMRFSRITHFPGDVLKQYLEHIGVKFGESLNTYTVIDETAYNISSISVNTPGAVDSCLLILHDWSNDLTLDPKEIDKEQGVIDEKWCTRMSAMMRMQEKLLPMVYPGDKYANSFPIDTMDVVMNFKSQTLRDHYEKWYRPDLQGIVIVGDIDTDAVEARTKIMFTDIPAQPNVAEHICYPIADNKEPIICILRDKEQPHVRVLLFSKHGTIPDNQKGNVDYPIRQYARDLINSMLNARLNELARTAGPPCIYAGTQDDNFSAVKTKDAFLGVIVYKEDSIDNGIAILLREIERTRQFDSTETEYNHTRAEYLRQLESAYNKRDKQKSDKHINECICHLFDSGPVPGIENECTFINQIAPNIPVTTINQSMKGLITDNNQIVALFAPGEEGLELLFEATINKLLKGTKAEKLTVYVDKVSDEPSMAEVPKGGKIVFRTKDDIFGTTTLTLSNGVKAITKKTGFKAGEVHIKGVSLGGSSLFPDSETISISGLDAVGVGGLGNFNAVDLEKVLTGKRVSVNYNISLTTENVSGSYSPKDFETMAQPTYLTFTVPHRDSDASVPYKSRNKAALKNQELNSNVAPNDSTQADVYMNHSKAKRIKAGMVDQMDYNKILSIYQDRSKDASDFTFIFVGDVDAEKMKPVIAEYLGALLATSRQEIFKDSKVEVRQGVYENEFAKRQEIPKASVFVFYSGDCKYDLRNNLLPGVTSQILNPVYTERIHEDEGGTYEVCVGGRLQEYPKEEVPLQIIFGTTPDKKEKLMKIIFDEIANIAKIGPSEASLNKVKEYMLKRYIEDLEENSCWLGSTNEYLYTSVNRVNDYRKIVNSITVSDTRKFADDSFKQKNGVEATMVSVENK